MNWMVCNSLPKRSSRMSPKENSSDAESASACNALVRESIPGAASRRMVKAICGFDPLAMLWL